MNLLGIPGKFINAHLIGFDPAPCGVKAARPGFPRTDSILAVVGGGKIPARIAQGAYARAPDQLLHILAEAQGIRLRVTQLVDSIVNAAVQVLDKGARHAFFYPSDDKVLVISDCRLHIYPFTAPSMMPFSKYF